VAAFGGAVRALGAAKASALPSFTPAVTKLVSVPVLGRPPTRLEMLGIGLATLGLAESGVKRNIPGRRGNAPAVNGNPGWRDVGRDASDVGREGAAGRAEG
jgi:hypothetical protein